MPRSLWRFTCALALTSNHYPSHLRSLLERKARQPVESGAELCDRSQ